MFGLHFAAVSQHLQVYCWTTWKKLLNQSSAKGARFEHGA